LSGPLLLDVNVLLGWLWPAHQTHAAAMKWMKSLGGGQWASCPITQMGFLRIVTNPAFSPDVPNWSEASSILLNHTSNRQSHVFWQDSLTIDEIDRRFGKSIKGSGQITDAYLLALAIRNKGRLVTFDHRIAALTPPGSSEHQALLILKP
jgi:uncharacterized protein